MKKLSLILVSLIIIVLLNFYFNKNDGNFNTKGKAKVIDGDTIKINGNKIRFGGIDAPEIIKVSWKTTNVLSGSK